MDAAEFRRKVILARIVALAVVLLLIAIAIFFTWSGSESGIVSKAEITLKSDHSEKNMLESLDHAEKFSREGKKDSAQRIEAAVDKSVIGSTADPQGVAKTYLELAQELKKRGDNNYAQIYAFKTLKTLEDLFAKERASNNVGSLAVMFDTADSAAALLVQLNKPLNAAELKTALAVANAEEHYILRDAKDHLLDLCISSAEKTSAAASDELVKCYFNKDIEFARQGQPEELEKMLAKAKDLCSKLQDPSTVRPSPEPCLLQHYINIAAAIENNSLLASKYLGYADDLLARIDVSKLDENQKLALTDSLSQMSRAYLVIDEKSKALSLAKQAATIRPLQDAASASAVNQLLAVFVAEKHYREAEPVAAKAYKFYKANTEDAAIQAARGEFIIQYFPALVGLQKTSTAISILNDEIKLQKKLLPASVSTVVNLQCRLADYYVSKNMLKAAADCAQKMADASKMMSGDERLKLNLMLIDYATKTKTPSLAVNASKDAVSYINKNRRSAVGPDLIEGLCSALDSIKKNDSDDTYTQAVDLIKTGFVQQLSAPNCDPVLLAKVINTLGTSGEEKDADALRTQAKEKLPAAKASTFLAQSMDFVVNGEQDSAQYSEPKNAIKVYMDMAKSMSGKDDESAFKNAFEAIKIVHVLAQKNADLPEDLLATMDDASAIMITCRKQVPDDDQLKVLTELSSLEENYIRNSGKGRILDLTLVSHAKRHTRATDNLLSLMLLRDEMLAKKGQVAALDAQLNQTREAISELHPDGAAYETNVSFAKHLVDIADQLTQHKESFTARKFLNAARKTLDDIASEQSSRLAEYNQAKAAAAKAAATPGVSPDANKPLPAAPPPVDRIRLGDLWNRVSVLYARAGDSQSALASAKKAVALRPMQDASSVRMTLNLVDRLTEAGAYGESEQLAADAYNFCKARTSPDYLPLHIFAAKKLLQIERQLHRDSNVDALARSEFTMLKDLPGAQLTSANDMLADLADYFVAHQDAASAAVCIAKIQESQAALKPEQRAAWDRAGGLSRLLVLSLRIRNPKLAAAEVNELSNSRVVDRGNAVNTPLKWWPNAMVTFRRSGEEKAYKQVLGLLGDNFKQELSKPSPDAAALGDLLSELSSIGETDGAQNLRSLALAKLSDADKEVLNTHCKNLPADAAGAKDDNRTPDMPDASTNTGQ